MLVAFANFVFVSCAIHHANVQGGVSNSVPTSMDNVTSINKGCGNYVEVMHEVMDSNSIELCDQHLNLRSLLAFLNVPLNHASDTIETCAANATPLTFLNVPFDHASDTIEDNITSMDHAFSGSTSPVLTPRLSSVISRSAFEEVRPLRSSNTLKTAPCP